MSAAVLDTAIWWTGAITWGLGGAAGLLWLWWSLVEQIMKQAGWLPPFAAALRQIARERAIKREQTHG